MFYMVGIRLNQSSSYRDTVPLAFDFRNLYSWICPRQRRGNPVSDTNFHKYISDNAEETLFKKIIFINVCQTTWGSPLWLSYKLYMHTYFQICTHSTRPNSELLPVDIPAVCVSRSSAILDRSVLTFTGKIWNNLADTACMNNKMHAYLYSQEWYLCLVLLSNVMYRYEAIKCCERNNGKCIYQHH